MTAEVVLVDPVVPGVVGGVDVGDLHLLRERRPEELEHVERIPLDDEVLRVLLRAPERPQGAERRGSRGRTSSPPSPAKRAPAARPLPRGRSLREKARDTRRQTVRSEHEVTHLVCSAHESNAIVGHSCSKRSGRRSTVTDGSFSPCPAHFSSRRSRCSSAAATSPGGRFTGSSRSARSRSPHRSRGARSTPRSSPSSATRRSTPATAPSTRRCSARSSRSAATPPSSRSSPPTTPARSSPRG